MHRKLIACFRTLDMPVLESTLGDITRLEVAAIVNAANERMLGGGGVDGAIHAAAGPRLYEACLALPEIEPGIRSREGSAITTPGFNLSCRYIIHTVGPRWRGGGQGEASVLESCYRACILAAGNMGVDSIAFPAISTGVFGYPKHLAAPIAVDAVRRALPDAKSITRVIFCAFDSEWKQLIDAQLEGA